MSPSSRRSRSCVNTVASPAGHPAQPTNQRNSRLVLQLLHQQPLTPHRVEALEQQRAEQFLGRNRRPTDGRVTVGQIAATTARRSPPSLTPDGAQRVIRRHALFGRDVTEHPPALLVIATHRHTPFNSVGSIVGQRVRMLESPGSHFFSNC